MIHEGSSKFLQWLETALSGSETVELFEDEIRSFIHVDDVCRALLRLIELWETEPRGEAWLGRIFNCGGPEPFSRIGLAQILAAARPGLLDDALRLRPTRRAHLDEKLGYSSPLDISMDSHEFEAVLGFSFRPLRSALCLSVPAIFLKEN